MTQPSTRILVLGAGVAGLLFTLRLAVKVAREPVQITLVDESDTFMVRPRLHEFATHQHVFRRSFSQILRKTWSSTRSASLLATCASGRQAQSVR
jgi:NADH dehydrogenase FAD-containing subunit